ncbi:hypothetical protein B5C34_04410 [Pacificimonas flava]|uniref:Anti-sigma K factor RskA C-terminal domain-containing protein n=2 Tax=Pacificimonas TaxID=1960290 RepID=A0A219B357_9SPHN|nr:MULTISPECIES: anti-sigma factor [Pacificimonas]MBZ6377540.1 anti-sigma factor [Pacificimonas aurantium]OWV32767.1 hypothetical protein B5C34_04410 [Pacificimonas flava]
MSDGIPAPDRPSIDAAEFVLGLLSDAEHQQARVRLQTDEAFRREVARWERFVAPLFEDSPEIAPSEEVLASLKRRLDRGGALRRASNDNPKNVVPAFWRNYGVAMTFIAATLGAFLLLDTPERPEHGTYMPPTGAEAPARPQGPAEVLAARVSPEEGIPVAVITYLPDSGELVVAPVSIAAGSEQVPELWFIPGDGTPRSLGLIDAADGARVQLPDGFDREATLAISIEPEGGSPTGAPTGPIVGTGTLSAI